MSSCPALLFRKRQFDATVIVTCVRWYLRFALSLRDLEEIMAERGLSVDHTTVWRWVQVYVSRGPPPIARARQIQTGNVVHG